MIVVYRRLPYRALKPLTQELMHDSAPSLGEFDFTSGGSFSELVERDVVPWILSWGPALIEKLRYSLAFEWVFYKSALVAHLENADQHFLIPEEYESTWSSLFEAMFDEPIDDFADSAAPLLKSAEVKSSEAESFVAVPDVPEVLWLVALQQSRSIASQTETVGAFVGDRQLGLIRKSVLRDLPETSGRPSSLIRAETVEEARILYEALADLIPGLGGRAGDLTDEQVVTVRFIRELARRSIETGEALRLKSH